MAKTKINRRFKVLECAKEFRKSHVDMTLEYKRERRAYILRVSPITVEGCFNSWTSDCPVFFVKIKEVYRNSDKAFNEADRLAVAMYDDLFKAVNDRYGLKVDRNDFLEL